MHDEMKRIQLFTTYTCNYNVGDWRSSKVVSERLGRSKSSEYTGLLGRKLFKSYNKKEHGTIKVVIFLVIELKKQWRIPLHKGSPLLLIT